MAFKLCALLRSGNSPRECDDSELKTRERSRHCEAAREDMTRNDQLSFFLTPLVEMCVIFREVECWGPTSVVSFGQL